MPPPPSDLTELRQSIEAIDKRILDCLRERMELSNRIADAKIKTAVPFRDQRRAEEHLQTIRHLAAEQGLDPHQLEHLYRLIMEMSIRHQQHHLESLAEVPLRVAYQGVEGSYSHLTAQRRYAQRPSGVVLNGYETFRGAAASVRDGSNDLALLPIENSTAGSINDTYDLLAEGGLSINAEAITEVRHCLLGLPGTSIEQIRMVISHPQALRQCELFLEKLGITVREEFDTAGAARRVKHGNDPTIAAVAGESAAETFALEVLARDIQDQRANYTRFVEVAIEAALFSPDLPCKTSLLLATGHRPGELGEVLRQFSDRNINLSKLESRPVPGKAWQYRFYLDVDGHAQSGPLLEALSAIRSLTKELRVLGTYPKASMPEPISDAAIEITVQATSAVPPSTE